MNEKTIYDELYFMLFDHFGEKFNSNCIGGRWNNLLVLKDGSKASFARIKDIDFSRMPQFCTHVVFNGNWQEVKHIKDSQSFCEEFYKEFIEGHSEETVIVIVDCYVEKGRSVIGDCIIEIEQGKSSEAQYVFNSLLEGEQLEIYEEIVHKWAIYHSDKYVRHHLIQAWAFHCLQTGNLIAIQEIRKLDEDTRRFIIVAFEYACKHIELPKGIEEVVLQCLEDEAESVRQQTACTLAHLGREQYNLLPYIDALETHLHDHVKPKYGKQTAIFAASALYAATLMDETRASAIVILKNHITDSDKKTSAICTAAYVHYLVDIGNFTVIDQLIASKSKNIRLGAANGLGDAVAAIKESIDLTPIQDNLKRTTDGKISNKKKYITTNIYIKDFNFQPVLERLMILLKDKCKDVQRSAAETFHEASKKRQNIIPAIPLLIETLKSGNESTIQEISSILARSFYKLSEERIEQAVNELKLLLDHKNGNVRKEAAHAIHVAEGVLEKRN